MEIIYDYPVVVSLIVIATIVYYIFKKHVTEKMNAMYKTYKKVPTFTGLTGAEAARKLLDANDLFQVKVEQSAQGAWSDHYDSYAKTVRLSKNHFNRSSLIGITIAAHEVGHAIQDRDKNYSYRFQQKLFSFIVFVMKFHVQTILIILGIGLILFAVFGLERENVLMTPTFISGGVLAVVGLILPILELVFSIATLKVETDASYRAINEMKRMEMIGNAEEEQRVKEILDVARLTYVIAVFE